MLNIFVKSGDDLVIRQNLNYILERKRKSSKRAAATACLTVADVVRPVTISLMAMA